MIVTGDVPSVTVGPGVRRKVLAADGSLMAVEVSFQKGSVGAPHSHSHQQIGYIVKGRFELEMEGTRTIVQTGDSYYAQPNVVHGVVALEDSVLLDVFTPQREDFLK